MMYLLGIDIGTSACKAAAFTRDGTEAASAVEPYSVVYPAEGYAEQDAREWYAAVCRAVRAVAEKVGAGNIAGVGVDGQSWSCILCGADGEPLAPTPIWFDRRAAAQCERIKQAVGEDILFSVCGNPAQPSYTTPKELWFRENAPDLYKRTYKILQSNSFIVMKLTGEYTSDVSQGYGCFFFDMAKKRFDADIAREIGCDLSLYPDLRDSFEVVGRVTQAAARETGLVAGTPVVAGGLDAACGTLGVGVYRDGQTQEQSGTSGGMSICTEKCAPHKKLILGVHVTGGSYLLQGGTTGGGGSMKWFAEQFGASFAGDDGDRSVFSKIDDEAATAAPGSDGVVFLPYMAGERSPIWDARAKAVWFGLSYSVGRAQMARALMEGVAYSLRHNLDTAREAGASPDVLYPAGGGANSRVWTQIKADVTGLPFAVPNPGSAATLGAAMLAGVGVGVWNSFGDAVRDTVRISRTQNPDPSARDAYDRGYGKYLALYESVKNLY